MTLETADLRARAATLHREVHESLQVQFAATLKDLQQLRSLLGDATAKLSGAFQTMIHQARAQRETAARLEPADQPAAREINVLAEDIARGSLLVVQSLQFEDMATQLLAHVDRRLGWLESFARDAAPLQTAVVDGVVGVTVEEFAAVEHSLAKRREEVLAWRKVVNQQSLDEGDIELF